MQRNFKKTLAFLIGVYQKKISPLLAPRCRFYPSCSHYAVASLEKFGVLRALIKISFRLLRCNPFFKGGVDLP